MRIISALLCFCLSFNVLASTGTVQELERAIDEYQYALTVDWDQKDPTFMQEKTEDFFGALSVMMENGLSAEEIMNVISKKSKDPKAVEFLKMKLSQVTKDANSPSEVAKVLSENSKEFYSTGANWNGSTYVIVGVSVVVVSLLAYSIWWESNHVCVATATGQKCGWIAYYHGGPQYYQCWDTTYCTQYAKK